RAGAAASIHAARVFDALQQARILWDVAGGEHAMILKRFFVGLAFAGFAAAAAAQDFPTRPMTMVVAAAAGGPIDVFGRFLADRMGAQLGQRILIENVGGGGGTLGGQHVVRSPADGYTMLLGTLATHANPQLMSSKPLYNPVTDFVPVTLIA